MDVYTDYFKILERNITYRREREDENIELEIDSHFYGLTLLNNPGEAIEADYVAHVIIPISRY